MVRRLVQLTASLALACSAVMVVGSFTAAGASGSRQSRPAVLQASWFWQNAYEQSNPPVAAGPPPASEPSGVPDGDLAVAHTSSDGTSSKMTTLAFDIGTLAPGTVVDSFSFSVTVDGSPQAANANAGDVPIVACLPTRLWAAELGGDYTDEPAVDCSAKVKPKVSGGTYTFDIPQIAQRWIDDQNLGVALVNDPDNTQTPFQIVFTGAKTVKAAMSYTPAAPVVRQPPASTGAGGTTVVSGGSSGGSTAGGSAVVPPPVGAVPGDAATGSPPASGQPPQVAPPQTPRIAPVAKVANATSAPNRAFWLGAAALALLLLLMSLVLGDEPQAAATSGSRLDRVLRGASGEPSALATRS